MKKKDKDDSAFYDETGAEVSNADLSDFEDYKPFEGKDDIDNLDDDFSFLNSYLAEAFFLDKLRS